MVLYKTENIINEYSILIGTRYWYKRINNTLSTELYMLEITLLELEWTISILNKKSIVSNYALKYNS